MPLHTASVENLGPLINDLSRIWRARLDQRLKPMGLSQVQWRVLLLLARLDTAPRQGELAEHIGVEGPTLVKLLDRMARRGWVQRRPSPEDRRCKTVHLTPKARGTVRKIRKVTWGFRKQLFAAVPPDELQRCMHTLRTLLSKAEEL
ncbi:MAG TPA: MarR family transcriptional regulator [Gammaproteobacteria bacterium]|jgi:MarR family transcriptional regulator for hemolysin